MEKLTNNELLDVLTPNILESNKLTKKQKVLLAQLVLYDGLDKKDENGFFFRSNKDLCNDCNISEPTLIVSVQKLESLGFIERKRGSRESGASMYKVDKNMVYSDNIPVNDYLKKIEQNFSNKLEAMSLKINELENLLKNVLEKNFSTDTEPEIEKEKNNINNNIYKNNIPEYIPDISGENSKKNSLIKLKDNLNNNSISSYILSFLQQIEQIETPEDLELQEYVFKEWSKYNPVNSKEYEIIKKSLENASIKLKENAGTNFNKIEPLLQESNDIIYQKVYTKSSINSSDS